MPSLPAAIPALHLAEPIDIHHPRRKGPSGGGEPGRGLAVPSPGSPCARAVSLLECFSQLSLSDSAEEFCITSDHSLTVLTRGSIS